MSKKILKGNGTMAKAVLPVCVSAVLAFTVLCGSAHGVQDLTDLSIEQLMKIEVFGASKFLQKQSEAPSSVSIVTADDIKKFGYRTLADILRSVRSFNMSYARDYSYGGVRGFGRPGDYNSRILVIVDGHRINENIYEGAFLGNEFPVDVDLIERVEVIRGPGSSLYGNNAFFAVINVITKGGKDLKGFEISGEAGSFEAYKGRISYGNTFQNGAEVLVSGTGFDNKGDNLYFREFDPAYSTDPRAANDGYADHRDYERNQSVLGKFSYRGFSLEGAYVSRTKGIPIASYLTDFNASGSKYVDSHGYVDVKYEGSLGKETDVAVRAFYDDYRYRGDYPSTVVYGVPLNKTRAQGAWWGGEGKLTSRLFEAHHVTVGAEYTDNFRKDHKNYDVDPYYVYDDNRKSSTIWALYLQDEFKITRNLILNAGVRYDRYSTFGGTTNPRLALIYNPFEKSTIKLLYGTAFRAPNDYEMLYTNVGQAANPSLQPEKIKTYELVYEQHLGEGFRMTASGYYYKITGLIESVPSAEPDTWIYRNVEDVDAKGIELELEKIWGNGFKGRISYTIQSTEDGNGAQLTNSPEHMAKFNLLAPVVAKKVFAGLEGQYTSKRKTLAGNYAGGFFTANFTLFCQNILEGLDVSGSVYNLFDKKYSHPGVEGPDPVYSVLDSIRQDGRTFRLQLTYRF